NSERFRTFAFWVMSRSLDWTLLSFQPLDCRPLQPISAYSGPFAPDLPPKSNCHVLGNLQSAFTVTLSGRMKDSRITSPTCRLIRHVDQRLERSAERR